MMAVSKLPSRWELGVEISTWAVIILVLIFFKFLPQKIVNDDISLILIGAILSFALFYYLIIYHWFNRSQRFYLKSLADVIFIGILLHFARDFDNILFSLYFLPILSASLVLNLMNSLITVTIASAMVGLEILLNYKYDTGSGSGGTATYIAVWQIFFLIITSLFVRFLALQLQKERQEKEEAMLERKMMIQTSHRLQNPLSIIRHYAATLQEGDFGKLSARQKEYIKTIHQKSKQVIKVLTGMIKLDKREAEQIEKINIETGSNQ